MQQFMTIFDQFPSSWQAAYTAFDVAARLNAKLVGVILLDHLGPDRAAEIMQEFETGARAARIEYESLIIPELVHLTQAQVQAINGLFIGRPNPDGWLDDNPFVQRLIEQLPCPIWIVPQQREIRQILALIERGAMNEGTLQFGKYLAKRWNQALRFLAVYDASNPPNPPLIPTTASFISTPIDPERLLLTFAAEHADLVIIGKPNGSLPVWEICRQINCLVVICPPAL